MVGAVVLAVFLSCPDHPGYYAIMVRMILERLAGVFLFFFRVPLGLGSVNLASNCNGKLVALSCL